MLRAGNAPAQADKDTEGAAEVTMSTGDFALFISIINLVLLFAILIKDAT